jgi:glycosyltransferase involved in cell wall biosynthesis
MKLHVICAAYKRAIPLRILIDSFLVQTNPNWMLYVIHDGKMPTDVLGIIKQYNDERISFEYTKTRTAHSGFINRDMMIKKTVGADEDFVMSTNDDNYYPPTFVDEMLKLITPTAGIIYCNMIHSHFGYTVLSTILQVYYIDLGAFAVRLPLAKKVGIKASSDIADGLFAQDCLNECNKVGMTTHKTEKIIFVHN